MGMSSVQLESATPYLITRQKNLENGSAVKISSRLGLIVLTLSLRLVLLGVILVFAHGALPCFAASNAPPLPDAPTPQMNSPSATSSSSKPYANFYWRTIPHAYQARKLTVTGKLKFMGHEMIDPMDLAPAVLSGQWGDLVDSDPNYGTNATAFGERFGAAIVRQTSFRLFADGLLPIAFHEDPRYYRLGRSHTWKRRLGYALTRVFIGRNDAGDNTPNYSAVLGRAFGAALTPAYYPGVSRNSRVVFDTFGTAIAGEMGLDFLREFVPGTRF